MVPGTRLLPLAFVAALMPRRVLAQPRPGAPPMRLQFAGDAQHTGRTDARGPHSMPQLAWRVRALHRVFASPLVSLDGEVTPAIQSRAGGPTIVFAGIDGAIHALDARGVERWAAGSQSAVFATPAIARGLLLVARDGGAIDALDGRGRRVWTHPLEGDVDAPLVLDAAGTVFCATGRLEALDVATGAVRWQAPLRSHVSGAPALTRDGATLVVADVSGELLWLDAHTGAVRRRGRVGAPVRGGVLALDDGTVVIGATDGHVRAFAADGSLRWDAVTRDEVRATPALSRDGSTVIVGSDDGGVYGLRVRDGSQAFRVATSGRVRSSATVDADGFAFVGSEDDMLYAIDPHGAVAWRYNLGADVDSSPAILPTGALAVGCDDGALDVLVPAAGQPR